VGNNLVQADLDLLPAIYIDSVLVEPCGETLERCSIAINHAPIGRGARRHGERMSGNK